MALAFQKKAYLLPFAGVYNMEAYLDNSATTPPCAQAIEAMQRAAAEGRDSTRDLVAKVGRAARLGERSKGVLDAGATSCCLLLTAMGDAMKQNC